MKVTGGSVYRLEFKLDTEERQKKKKRVRKVNKLKNSSSSIWAWALISNMYHNAVSSIISQPCVGSFFFLHSVSPFFLRHFQCEQLKRKKFESRLMIVLPSNIINLSIWDFFAYVRPFFHLSVTCRYWTSVFFLSKVPLFTSNVFPVWRRSVLFFFHSFWIAFLYP